MLKHNYYKILVLSLPLLIIPASVMAGNSVLMSGKSLFNKYCSTCHGPKGSGSKKGPPLVNDIYRPDHHADISFQFAAKRGVRAHHWDFGNMPKIKGVNKDDVNKITQYIRGLQKEAGIY